MSSPQELFQPPQDGGLRVQSYVRPLLCTSSAVLVECDDGCCYIIHDPILPLEDSGFVACLLGPAIATAIGLSTLYTSYALVDRFLAQWHSEREMSFVGLTHTGWYCAERLAGAVSGSGRMFPYISPRRQGSIVNRADLIGMYLLSVWAGGGMPRAMFHTSNVNADIKTMFVGTSRLFGGIDVPLQPVALDFTPTRGGLYSGLWTADAVYAWLTTIQQRVPMALGHTFAGVAERWPSIDTSQMHSVLLERLSALDKAVCQYRY